MDAASASTCLLALGGNLPSLAGTPAETLRAALRRLEAQGAGIEAVSRFFRTPCFPAGAGPDYVNAAARLRWAGSAAELLNLCHEVEAEFGRERGVRWGRRTLDLDIVALDDMVCPDAATQARWRDLPAEEQVRRTPEQLILPHPRLQDRAFVLVPLCDVAPDWRHPLLGRTIAELAAKLPEKARNEVVPL